MKKWKLVFFPALFFVFYASCTVRVPDDGTLLLYVRAQGVYSEGRFTETAEMLAGENNFAPALLLRGKAEYLSGDFVKAEKSLKKVLSINSGDNEAALFLARLFRETGNKAEAQKLAEEILRCNPQDIRTLRFAAELAREKGISGEAASVAFLDRAIEASAEAALVFLDRARIRWTGGNGAGALEDLGRAKVLLQFDSPVMKAVEKLESIIEGAPL